MPRESSVIVSVNVFVYPPPGGRGLLFLHLVDDNLNICGRYLAVAVELVRCGIGILEGLVDEYFTMGKVGQILLGIALAVGDIGRTAKVITGKSHINSFFPILNKIIAF